jgi:hypothetical protein
MTNRSDRRLGRPRETRRRSERARTVLAPDPGTSSRPAAMRAASKRPDTWLTLDPGEISAKRRRARPPNVPYRHALRACPAPYCRGRRGHHRRSPVRGGPRRHRTREVLSLARPLEALPREARHHLPLERDKCIRHAAGINTLHRIQEISLTTLNLTQPRTAPVGVTANLSRPRASSVR